MQALEKDHWLKKELFSLIGSAVDEVSHLRDVDKIRLLLGENKNIKQAEITKIDLSRGNVVVDTITDSLLFYKILEEKTGVSVENEQSLMAAISDLSDIKAKYEKVKTALDEVERTGYGIVMPELSELTLEEPELMKQGGRYGVRLKASAPSIHMLRADIKTEVAPIVGNESQSEDLILYLMKQFEENPKEIWNSDIFGKSIYSIVNEGLNNKLARMPLDAREKMRETVQRVINEGCNGLICIIL